MGDADAALAAGSPEADDDPEAAIQAVRRAVADLPMTDREVLTARLARPDASYVELAAALGVAEGAVRTRHHRALRRLSAALDRDEAVRAWRDGLRHPGGRP